MAGDPVGLEKANSEELLPQGGRQKTSNVHKGVYCAQCWSGHHLGDVPPS